MGVSEKFVYDSTGNIIQLDDIVLKYSASDRLHRRGDMQYLYDGNGRLIKKIEDCENQTPKVWLFEWDAEDQLRKVTTPVGEIWEYKYDALGRRIVKQGSKTTTRFVWNGNVIVHQVENQKVLHSSWVFDPYSFAPLCKVQNEQLYSVICDHLGTPKELLDVEGKVVWSVSYKAWGKVEETQVGDIDCPIRFQGQWADEESGLYYNRFRYYEAQSGRFVSADLIRLASGINLYQYVQNPLRLVDPMGLSVCETVLSILGKIWTLPNTLIGLVYGFTGHILGLLMGSQPRITLGNNAIQFTNNPLMISAMTLGNVIVYGSGYNPASLGIEEMQHTFQAEILGPFYFPAHLILGTAAVINNNNWHGSTNLLEIGPHSPTPRPWP